MNIMLLLISNYPGIKLNWSSSVLAAEVLPSYYYIFWYIFNNFIPPPLSLFSSIQTLL